MPPRFSLLVPCKNPSGIIIREPFAAFCDIGHRMQKYRRRRKNATAQHYSLLRCCVETVAKEKSRIYVFDTKNRRKEVGKKLFYFIFFQQVRYDRPASNRCVKTSIDDLFSPYAIVCTLNIRCFAVASTHDGIILAAGPARFSVRKPSSANIAHHASE